MVDAIPLSIAGEVRRLLFMTYQTHRMVSAFRDRYYEAIEAKG